MTVMIAYKAEVARLPDNRFGVMVERGIDVGGRNRSHIGILLTSEDALRMVGTYRERESGRFFDAWGDGGEMFLDMVPCESYSLVWRKDGERVEDDLWSDWPEAFMAEIESAAREAMG